ncbi:uncharacterized protein HGUI_01898 [Hanseniaspora guilliermondii]|uniref:Septin-type G domain-containing protein n=1 Tax=Hanseniaspora guilliermondii TaxID=56406 RepID=A0A1L0AZX1_9ASCO|nr:uncharacterized protein HGUI_01898 [Hanseniaspora guilliermondii]
MNTGDLNTPISSNSHIDTSNSTATQAEYEENTARPVIESSSSSNPEQVLGSSLSDDFARITHQLNQQHLENEGNQPQILNNDVVSPIDRDNASVHDDLPDTGSISKETFNMYNALNNNSSIIDSGGPLVPIKFPSGGTGNTESMSGIPNLLNGGFLKKSSSKIGSALSRASNSLAASANSLTKQSPMTKVFTGTSFESFKFKELEDRVISNYSSNEIITNDDDASLKELEEQEKKPREPLPLNKNIWGMNEGEINIDSNRLVKLNPNMDIGLENLPKQRLSKVFKHPNSSIPYTEKTSSNNMVNLMVVGQQGMGKSTFVNTLFQNEILKTGIDFKNEYFDSGSIIAKKRIFQEYSDPLNEDTPTTTSIQKTYVMLEEANVNLKLCIIDTPGFGDFSDNSFSWVPICEYIDAQYTDYMFNEEQPYRDLLVDSRVHCCLYFINATNKGLTALDVISMQEISKRVNLVPVIAKSDGLTRSEIVNFKKDIKETIRVQNIKICDLLLGGDCGDDDYDYPFGVVGGQYYEDRQTFGRKYRHGFVDVMDERVSDFLKLRKFLVEEKTLDLIEKTSMYYEEWRDKLCLFRYKKMNELLRMKETGEEYEEGAVEKLLIPVIEESKMKKMDGMVFEGEEINKNKLRCYEVYEVINKKYLDRHMIDWDPIFIHKQWELKKAFNSAVYEQDKKFKEWKRTLFNKQSKYNEEIDMMHNKVKTYQRECAKMEDMISKMRMRELRSMHDMKVL